MKTKITVNSNGSLKVEGEFEIVDKQGNTYGLGGRNVISFCRCGLSKNKPFCDGSHKGSSFVPTIEVFDEDRKVAWCGCKQSTKGAFCDGTHKNL